jgi:hypothetical protein
MATPPDKDDAEWLDALAGKATATAQPQAEALRRALFEHRARLEHAVPKADDLQYQRLLFRLRQEGLTAKRGGFKRSPATWGWGIAASVVAVGFALQFGLLQRGGADQDDLMAMRGDANTVYIIDEKPAERAAELAAGLSAIKAEFQQTALSFGKTEFRIQANDAVLAYLEAKRITPTVVNGQIAIIVSPRNAKKQ